MFDDSKRLDTLESQVAALTKQNAASVEAANKGIKELADKHQSLIDQLNDFTKLYNKSVTDLDKADIDLAAEFKKLQQRVATLEADMKKVKK
jgi:predicted  nucleic acid-binding Zn-ribbon protein